MNNPAYIVDGFMEKEIIKRICPDHAIRRLDLNGRDVPISLMAKKIALLIRLLNNKCYPIIIVVDREQRIQPAESISAELRKTLLQLGVKDKLIIGVADRNIESWILADWASMEGKVNKQSPKPKQAESTNGKSKLKELVKGYRETTDGVEFFVGARPCEMAKNSPSFKAFFTQLNSLKCKWFDKKKTS